MTPIKYHHVVKYDEKAKKITITRVFESGFDLIKTDLCTELSLSDLNQPEKTFERVSQWLGEALIFDTPGLRDEFPRQAAILRDAVLRTAPQDEVGVCCGSASRSPHGEERRRCVRATDIGLGNDASRTTRAGMRRYALSV